MNNRRITHREIEENLINLRQLTFEVTDSCNLQCKYCGYGEFYSGYDLRKASFMTLSQVRPLLDYLANLWNSHKTQARSPLTYFSFYGGEPLLNMTFIQQVTNYVKSVYSNRTPVFSMTTNALLLEKYADFLVENQFRLLISLDGDQEGHSYRVDKAGGSSFHKVYYNVKRIQEKFPEYFSHNVNFNAVLHNRNSVETIYSFIKNEFGKSPRISELNASGIREDKRAVFEQTYRNKSESLQRAGNCEQLSEALFIDDPATNDLWLYLHQYSGNVFTSYKDLFKSENSLSYTPTGTCSPFSKKLFVTVNGKILPCEKIGHRFAVGNVCEKGMALSIEAIAERVNGYFDKMQPQCSTCQRKRSCIQCLYFIDSIDSSYPKCKSYMTKEQFAQYTSYCLNHLYRHPLLYRKLLKDVVVL